MTVEHVPGMIMKNTPWVGPTTWSISCSCGWETETPDSIGAHRSLRRALKAHLDEAADQ